MYYFKIDTKRIVAAPQHALTLCARAIALLVNRSGRVVRTRHPEK